MRSETHFIAAAPRISQNARSMRRPPHGGRRMERAFREMCGAAAMECVSERISERLSQRSSSCALRDEHQL
eukprot:1274319-Lingulodinium_polyedra.AAC.1